MRHTILHADVMDGLRSLPDRSVHCIITSPPYWGLRDYGVEGQIGLEPTPEEYVARMVEVFREVRRVLRDDGTLWLNLGDSYAGGGGFAPNAPSTATSISGRYGTTGALISYGGIRPQGSIKPKDLVGIPWRVAFALQADGWYLRSDIIWHKPNPMPESVRDRPTKAHEHMFLLTKSRRYYYDADAVREPCATTDRERGNGNGPYRADHFNHNPLGRNRRDVWTIPTRPYKGAHFATFPPALVEPCIKAGTSERGCCPECGAPWRRVVEREKADRIDRTDNPNQRGLMRCPSQLDKTRTVGFEPSCTCGTGETVPCVVLDPFGGSGTVAKVARDLGRSSVMIELNPEYVGIMKKRLRCGGQLDGDADEIHVTSLPLTDEGVV